MFSQFSPHCYSYINTDPTHRVKAPEGKNCDFKAFTDSAGLNFNVRAVRLSTICNNLCQKGQPRKGSLIGPGMLACATRGVFYISNDYKKAMV